MSRVRTAPTVREKTKTHGALTIPTLIRSAEIGLCGRFEKIRKEIAQIVGLMTNRSLQIDRNRETRSTQGYIRPAHLTRFWMH